MNGKPSIIRVLIYAFLYFLPVFVFSVFLELRKRKKEVDETVLKPYHRRMTVLFFLGLYFFGILFLRAERPGQNEVRYVQLSVGQGDSEFICTKDFTMVVDNGSSTREDAGEILTNALKYYGISKIDVLCFTHSDLDHTNGVSDVLKDPVIRISEIWISGSSEEIPGYYEYLKEADKTISIIPVRKGFSYEKNQVRISVLNPMDRSFGNEASVVLNVRIGSFSALLTGDISSETEQKIPVSGESFTVLKVAHHGSRFSSDERFLRSFHADIAMVSAGADNSYGHPHQETLKRLYRNGMKVVSTKYDGAAELHYQNGNTEIIRFHSKYKRKD